MNLDFKKSEQEAKEKYYAGKYTATVEMIAECEIQIAFTHDEQSRKLLNELYGSENVDKNLKALENALREKRSLKGFLEKYLK